MVNGCGLNNHPVFVSGLRRRNWVRLAAVALTAIAYWLVLTWALKVRLEIKIPLQIVTSSHQPGLTVTMARLSLLPDLPYSQTLPTARKSVSCRIATLLPTRVAALTHPHHMQTHTHA